MLLQRKNFPKTVSNRAHLTSAKGKKVSGWSVSEVGLMLCICVGYIVLLLVYFSVMSNNPIEAISTLLSIPQPINMTLYQQSNPYPTLSQDRLVTNLSECHVTVWKHYHIVGLFNTGTNAFKGVAPQNCVPQPLINANNRTIPNNKSEFFTVLEPTEWWKHNLLNLAIINKQQHYQILGVVLIKDPLTWFKSVCKAPYALRQQIVQWKQFRTHCPNGLKQFSSVRIRFNFMREYLSNNRTCIYHANMKHISTLSCLGIDITALNSTGNIEHVTFANLFNPKNVQSVSFLKRNPQILEWVEFKSLVHFWNEWYERYLYGFFQHPVSELEPGQKVEPISKSEPETKTERRQKTDDTSFLFHAHCIFIRFEDFLFRTKELNSIFCQQCTHGFPSVNRKQQMFSNARIYDTKNDFVFMDEPSKIHGRPRSRETALKTFSDKNYRFSKYSKDDLIYIHKHVNWDLMRTFGYEFDLKEAIDIVSRFSRSNAEN
ncbi:hypothetical protein RFI_06283 [Reticulomyxa filosa]|uniref:Uncharacterized protein n=1 Tax=Reticulomyxa filosa TaxID=46433 RepID=X6NYC4_RETFI|nr:hypothetical protein RFI_06283 [Reticulomyxa filosa]|eukprot:ETO30834.1 hypothetical protein RFI_06283 [Reticulomyxa filosa]